MLKTNLIRGLLVTLLYSGLLSMGHAAVIYVVAPIGQPGCDLVDAINSANNNANEGGCLAIGGYGDDTIRLTLDQILVAPTAGETRNGLPVIQSTITISGEDSANSNNWFKIARSDASGTAEFRIFNVRNSGNLTLSKLEVANGSFEHDVTPGFIVGAGVFVEQGQMTTKDVAFHSHVGDRGGALGASSSGSLVSIERTTFYNNRSKTSGAAIWVGPEADIKIYDSTITNNTSDAVGAAISVTAFNDGLSLSILNTTISDNTAEAFAGGLYIASTGTSVVDPENAIVVRNSIISGNNSGSSSSSGDDIYIGNEPAHAKYPNVTLDNNIVGQAEKTSTQSVHNAIVPASDLASSNAERPAPLRRIIKPLTVLDTGAAYYALADNSIAIDAGVPFRSFVSFPLQYFLPGCRGLLLSIGVIPAYRADQNGTDRPIGGTCDIGAIEQMPQCTMFVIKSSNNNVAVVCI